MKFGMYYFFSALRSWDSADVYRTIAENHYDAGYFSNASKYYELARDNYGHARQMFLLAKEYFSEALKHAPEGEEKGMLESFIHAAEYGAKAMDVIYYIMDNMSLASYYYSVNDNKKGDYYVERANELVKDYNEYFTKYNMYANKLDRYFG
ncbi:hypothetical protein [Pyrococcus kukulkanii]|uniref:hypothetical protein n=1 Tax=Pyrococcus kukulkanii TaxID=1609559 RepID=UPI003562AC99